MLISLRRMSVNLNHSSDSEAGLLWEQLISIQLFHLLAFFETQKQTLTVGPTSPGGPFSPLLPRVPVAPWKPCRHCRLKIQLFPNYFFPVQGLQGHLQWEFRGLQQRNSSLKFPVQPRAHCSQHIVCESCSHHFPSPSQLWPSQQSWLCQQTCTGVYTLQAFDFHYIFRFRHSLEHSPLLQPPNITWLFSFSFKTCAGL